LFLASVIDIVFILCFLFFQTYGIMYVKSRHTIKKGNNKKRGMTKLFEIRIQ
jgi:hypothetical protein